MVFFAEMPGMIEELYKTFTERALFAACLFILAGSIYISVKTKFVQVRSIPFLSQGLKKAFLKRNEGEGEGKHTLSSGRALFTAMSTTLGISTLVGPVIAIQLGGPGALFGFVLTSFLGGAVTYVEVCLGVKFREKLENGKIMGGPMQYLKHLFSPRSAKFYALGCMILMMGWSAAQANQFAVVLSSPAFGAFQIPPLYSGIGLVVFVMLILLGGVKRIGSLSAKLVPLMFILYVGSSLWIILLNLGRMGTVINTIMHSVFSPYCMASGALVGGVVSALRWGIFKGVQTTEAGVGTQTIPHSLTESTDPKTQGVLAILATFSAGSLAFLSGCVALITNTWQDPANSLGMGMVIASYEQYFSFAGAVIVALSALLFGLGTILGNAFNGAQCYEYLTRNRRTRYYFSAMSLIIFLGAIGEAGTVWGAVDILLALIAVPHMAALLLAVRRSPEMFAIEFTPVREGS